MFSVVEQLLAVATQLGLITPMRQQLFGVLMTTAGGPDSTANALVQTCGRQGTSDKSSSVEHREREMVQIVMHCLVSEQPFNRFYTRVLGGLLNNHRRFGVGECLSCPQSATSNQNSATAIGRLVGPPLPSILISLVD